MFTRLYRLRGRSVFPQTPQKLTRKSWNSKNIDICNGSLRSSNLLHLHCKFDQSYHQFRKPYLTQNSRYLYSLFYAPATVVTFYCFFQEEFLAIMVIHCRMWNMRRISVLFLVILFLASKFIIHSAFGNSMLGNWYSGDLPMSFLSGLYCSPQIIVLWVMKGRKHTDRIPNSFIYGVLCPRILLYLYARAIPGNIFGFEPNYTCVGVYCGFFVV